MSSTGKAILAFAGVFLFIIAVFLIGFFDSLSEVINAENVETHYGTQINSIEEEAKDARILFWETTVYVSTYDVTYEDGSNDTIHVEYPVPQSGNHYIGEKLTVYKSGDRYAFERSKLFEHPALHRTGIGIIIFEAAVVLSIVYPRRHRFFNA
ncbi:MAG: hypothetical protein MJ108_02560 [Saccharofermentans sp.]|nr:hypothetical protein [Saccharofermentans sp.]